MAADSEQNPARVLAPLALVVCAIAFFAVLFSAGGDDGGAEPAARKQATERRDTGRRQPRVRRATYTVRTGDTLAGIAAKTGLPVERLQELNPELDPQALVSGQKIKLRE
jgi:hypothetical protein